MWAALESDGLTPLVASGVHGSIRQSDSVFTVGGGGDHWEEGVGRMKMKTIAQRQLSFFIRF